MFMRQIMDIIFSLFELLNLLFKNFLMITSLWPYSLFSPMQILDDESKRKSITEYLSMMDFLR